MNTRCLGVATLVVAVACAWAQGKGGFSAGQAAADILRSTAQSDGAFIAAGLMKDSFQSDNLATLMQYPTDEIVVVKLKGSEVRQAFEQSLKLYPQENTSFLQISGFEVEFSAAGDPGKRVLNVKFGTSDLDENRVYSIAMPATLGRGGSGYFKIWDRSKIISTVPSMTVESALRGKRVSESKSRWVAR